MRQVAIQESTQQEAEKLKAATEISETLKVENKVLKDKIEWLNKDIEFKTIKLNEFLAENGEKSNLIFELRKEGIKKDSEIKIQSATSLSLQ